MSAHSSRACTPVANTEASTGQFPPAARATRGEQQPSRAVLACNQVLGTYSLKEQVGTSEEPRGDELAPRNTNLDAQPSLTSRCSTKTSNSWQAPHDDYSEHPRGCQSGHSASHDAAPQLDQTYTDSDEDLVSSKLGIRRASSSTVSRVTGPNDFQCAEATSVHGDRPVPHFDLDGMPNEIITHIFSYLDVCDLLATSRTSHHLRTVSLQPFLRTLRLQHARSALPPLLYSPSRPSLSQLVARHILLTSTTQASRRLGRNLISIRLSRRLPQRPSAEVLVQRGVLPPECVQGTVAPGLVARKRAVEKEKLKDGLRHWVGGVWRGEVRERGEDVKQCEEKMGIGRVWRMRKFWECMANGDVAS